MGKGGANRETAAAERSLVGVDGPHLVTAEEAAVFCRVTPKVLRNWRGRGEGPPWIKLGRRVVYRRESVLDWLAQREISGGRKRATKTLKITAAPYKYNTALYQVTMPFFSTHTGKKERPKKVAPASCKTADEAIRWGEGERNRIMKSMGKGKEVAPTPIVMPVQNTTIKKTKTKEDTFSDVWQKFKLEHVELQKPATQAQYKTMWNRWFLPAFGSKPIDIVSEDDVAAFRIDLSAKLERTSANVVLGKLAKFWKWAKRRKIITAFPEIERFKVGKEPDLKVYSDAEMNALVTAAKGIGAQHEVIILLALDAGLRVSEICALEWGDVDFSTGVINVQHNLSCGVPETPKGGPGSVGMSKRLASALAKCKTSGDTHVLQGKRTPHAVTWAVNQAQEHAGLEKTGPHYLRHCCLSFVARNTKDPHKVKDHARHARLTTTERYMHVATLERKVETAALFDGPPVSQAGKQRGKKRKAAEAA